MKIIKTETLEQAQGIEAAICQNCGIPDGRGTERWSEVYEYPEGGFYISAPTAAGWGGYTFAQMMAGINADIIEVESSNDSNGFYVVITVE